MKRPWSKFYWADWRSDPRLRMCSLAARGLWMEMLALMHEAEPYGYLLVSGQAPTDAQLSVLVGAPPSQIPELIGELELVGVFSRTRKNVIYSRRMLRDDKRFREDRDNGSGGGNPKLTHGYNKPGFVYLIGPRSDGAYKIGISNNPRNRLKKIRYQHPGEGALDVLLAVPVDDMGSAEAVSHREFEASKKGEWFFFDPATLENATVFLRSLKGPPKEPEKPKNLEARDQKILSNDKISLGEIMEKFEEWYRAYPLHKARGAAEKAWPRALKFADADTLIAGALRYAHECRAKETEPKYRAHPATWLNEKRWLDEPEKPPAAVEVVDSERERWARRIQRWRETGFWLDNWGFPPSDPGCMAPVDLLSEQAA